MSNVDPQLLASWLAARSIARGLPAPVPDRGGLRVDTGQPDELRRYVFASAHPGITELAREIHQPGVLIKMCGRPSLLQAHVTPRWELHPDAYLMTKDAGRNPVPSLPSGFWMQVSTEGSITTARIFAEDDTLAASGYAVEHEGVFAFDRIATEAQHQRQGLGAALMAALGTAQQSQAAQRVLVATEQGRALYATLGWRVLSPYSTVSLPAA
ncbi:GNAT family N-acetyltransferase [Duganella dendranthematis]|jgi:GNAT superfamily N-acetyltransferase|uniref:GNAT family N-acetyltransferase n=1 Tax=Duganella dendranthematis TaxID=2728021 RepID=A0ABX6MFK5_9BURK|nr:GNAT family N-acetyltransferase [Duganella dendranthematis]QJD92805.1 GNAT family N-acetyltransferase [Duganella dendranthematis]